VPRPPDLAPAPLPTEELSSVVASAGLEWVQTTHAAIDVAMEEPAVSPSMPKRQRKPKKPMVAEPLQQVETQGGDNTDL
jgi:hypothetical protein